MIVFHASIYLDPRWLKAHEVLGQLVDFIGILLILVVRIELITQLLFEPRSPHQVTLMEICFLLHLEPPSILYDLTHELKIVSSTHKELAVIRVILLLNLITSDLWTTKCGSTCPSPTPNLILRTLLLKTLINLPNSSLLPLPLAPLDPLPRNHLRRHSRSLFSPPRRLL